MKPLPATVTDAELLSFIDEWAELMERDDCDAAFAFTDHNPNLRWTPQMIRDSIKCFGNADPDQRVTVDGGTADSGQQKTIRWLSPSFGEIRYGLNIDGSPSGVAASFVVNRTDAGVTVLFNVFEPAASQIDS